MKLALDTEGLHPSTVACLKMMQALQDARIRRALDMGCGDGLLAVLAARIFDAEILAADISPRAVEDARAHVRAQGMEGRIEVVRSDGFSHPEVAGRGPYGLVIANLLAETVSNLLPDIKKCLSSDGYAIIGGVLAWKAPQMEGLFSDYRLEIYDRIDASPWRAYLLCHKT